MILASRVRARYCKKKVIFEVGIFRVRPIEPKMKFDEFAISFHTALRQGGMKCGNWRRVFAHTFLIFFRDYSIIKLRIE